MENPGPTPDDANQPLIDAARQMREILLREAAAARRASLADLQALQEDKQEALGILASLAPPQAEDPALRAALRAMLAAAEENAMVLASVSGALESVQDRLRSDLAAETNPGTYNVASARRGRPFSLAASIDQRA